MAETTKGADKLREDVFTAVDDLNSALAAYYKAGGTVRIGLTPMVRGGRQRNDQNLVYADDGAR